LRRREVKRKQLLPSRDIAIPIDISAGAIPRRFIRYFLGVGLIRRLSQSLNAVTAESWLPRVSPHCNNVPVIQHVPHIEVDAAPRTPQPEWPAYQQVERLSRR
jgi:hypothetical protein